MPISSIRVEFPTQPFHPTSATYLELRDRLVDAAIFDWYVSDDGITYKLPQAEYFTRQSLSGAALRDLVVHIAKQLHPNARITVYSPEGYFTHNLEFLRNPFTAVQKADERRHSA